MYCISCGVKLADSEAKCPLCGTVPYHPEISRELGEPMYPKTGMPASQINRFVYPVVMTGLFVLPVIITVLCNLQIDGRVTWSGYVVGALALSYVTLILPSWFQKYHPAVFIPCDFAAAALYLLYIDIVTEGGWFLSFGLPVVGFAGLLITAVVILLRVLRRGHLYVFGGAAIAIGGFMPVMELLIVCTFPGTRFIGWSWHPMSAFILLGGVLIFLAISRPARETMERKLFL